MSDAKTLSDRIGSTTVIIDDLAERLAYGRLPQVKVGFGNSNPPHYIPDQFAEVVVKAIHAVLMQGRAVDAIHLAQAAGVPAVAEGIEDDMNVVILAPRALAPENDGDMGDDS